jgi:hypothetical protein
VHLLGSAVFAAAVLHTFFTKAIHKASHRFKKGSFLSYALILLGEVETVFIFWSALYLILLFVFAGGSETVSYIKTLHFTEPAFVFVIMAVSATRPVLEAAEAVIEMFSRVFPLSRAEAFLGSTLFLGPLLGSFITEPAAMTVCSLLLLKRYFNGSVSLRLRYWLLGVLFVNVSIGGVLTSFAAPPVLMVANIWGWDSRFMFVTFGWKAVGVVAVNAILAVALFRREKIVLADELFLRNKSDSKVPLWLILIHLAFLALIVRNAHHVLIFGLLFVLFLGVHAATSKYQVPIRYQESFFVAAFLGGLVVLGGAQAWWLSPLFPLLSDSALFLGATVLTAVMDNALLTYLGAQVVGITESAKYALVAGAVAGGGLTVIANAPNPVGYAILENTFGDGGVSPLLLLRAALLPTLIGCAALWLL